MKASNGRAFSCKEFEPGISKSTRSHHFEMLRQADIIVTRNEGTRNLSSLREEDLSQRFPGLLDLVVAED